MKKWFFTMEPTNKVTENDPRVDGSWEIVDQREGKKGNWRVFRGFTAM